MTETKQHSQHKQARGGASASAGERPARNGAGDRAARDGGGGRGGRDGAGGPALRTEDKVRLGLLALPTLALALSITMVSTYLGEVARRYTHQTIIIGVIVGGEGVMALWIPLFAGAWSDRLRTRIGGRLPFVLAGTIPAAVALALIGFLGTLVLVAAMAGVFFAFYFVAYEPYRAMYPDLVSDESKAGRAQSTQAVARGLGTGLALLGGGLLLSVARPLPFVVSAFVMVVAVAAFVVLIVRRGLVGRRPDDAEGGERPRELARRVAGLLVRHPALRAYFIANSLWEMALASMKAFVILYLTVGLKYSLPSASLMIGAVAFVILVGAGASGKAADRFGHIKVVRIALWAYGLGYLLLIFTTSRPLMGVAVPFIAVGGGTVMTMSYALLMPLMPEGEHGALTGFYSMSRGVGVVAGPILAGLAIALTRAQVFSNTQGFQAMWIICAAAALASLLFLGRLRDAEKDREALESE
ncbi:MAG TPA: MFS transporter [Solirubrobacteraceae bacterium]|nr:MFS transporter [Solirubrobacteraceae bacterium]